MDVRDLAARLDAGFAARSRLLPNRDRRAPPRQKTLQALLDWSYSLLTAPEQALLRRLAVFAGSWSLAAAEQVCADPAAPGAAVAADALRPPDIADLLLQLANKSLIALHHADGRYHMLETIRLFARQQLERAGEAEALGRRHLAWYLAAAEEGAAHLNGPRQPEWLARLEQEHDNFRVALAGALATGPLADAAQLGLALWKFWNARIFQSEGLRWLEQILARSAHEALPTPIRARLYNALGVLAHSSGRYDEAAVFHDHALALWRSQSDPAGVAAALLGQGWQSFNAMQLDQARQYAGESLAVARGTGDRRAVAAALTLFAVAAVQAGRLDGVADALAESLATWRAVDDTGNVATVLAIMAHAEQVRGHFEQAKPLVAEALRLQLQSGDTFGLVGSLVVLLDTALAAPNRLEGAAWAAQIAGVFAARDETIGGPPSPWATGETARVAKAGARLGARRFALHFAAGRALTPAGLLALGAAITQPAPAARAQPSPAVAAPAPDLPALTGREREVLRLVAAGLSNNEIAARLVVSRRTVEGHLRAIFSKLDVPSRSAAVRFALEHGLG
ncbi:MAG TPA: LuxR C-terminal-related transcriptional regulator [Chloroflexia bacterium]|nr:LuxR C-terminal-related transcriptional regulator [Chloroflexia bacterium]